MHNIESKEDFVNFVRQSQGIVNEATFMLLNKLANKDGFATMTLQIDAEPWTIGIMHDYCDIVVYIKNDKYRARLYDCISYDDFVKWCKNMLPLQVRTCS